MIVTGRVVAEWVAEGVKARLAEGDTAIGWLHKGQIVAGILYTDYTGTSMTMCGRVTNKAGVTRKWLFAIFDYPFNQLKVKQVWAVVSSGNLQSVKTSEHLGWKRETTLTDYFPDGDGIVYRMRRGDCRWLDVPQRQVHKDGRNGQIFSPGTRLQGCGSGNGSWQS